MQLIKNDLSSVILRDTVGLGSQTSQAAAAPSLPCTDESWLPGSAALSSYSKLPKWKIMLERECYERVNINTGMGRDKLRVPEVLLKRMLAEPRK